MKILFLTDNFPPEVNAPASRTYDHVKEWRKSGHEITVITCAPNFPKGKVYDGYKNKPYQTEVMDGIKVIRVWSYIAENKGFFKRTLDYISYSITSFLAGIFVKCDIIIATSPQFFTALSGRTLSFIKRKPWIMEVRDLWPESIKTVGVMKDNLFIKYFEWQEKRCYKSARHIVVVTDSFKRNLVGKGTDGMKISVVKNGVNRELFRPMKKDSAIVAQLGLEGKRVIGYIGTHGMAHKLDFILQCAKHMEGKNNYHFLLIGSGAKKDELLRLKDEMNIGNVTMLDSVPKTEVSRYISILDLALINLRKSDLFKTVIPSKIFENAGMEIPIIMGVEGEAKKIVEEYNAGLCFEPENEEDFIQNLNRLLTDADFYARCKEGCKRLSVNFDRKRLADNMLKVIEENVK
ncbi:glycosyltransferase family 4 protein [Bacteroides fragilis]|uniref:glycosyltransferase n=1 Tax=Phocaeicola dorei TaxID=357276 RepID=UPI003FEE04B7|nr:glycosyltransferase family 4 protein [Bacteroides fragilis]